MQHHIAAYRLLLLLYPARFKHTYREEMTHVFADLLADRCQTHRPLDVFRLWVHVIADTLSNASRERMEETMNSDAALTRSLLFAAPIAGFAAMALGGMYVGLAVLAAGLCVLVVRRRSLPEALIGSRHGRWWVWTLVGLFMLGSSLIAGKLSGEFDELSWLLFSALFFAGVLMVGASIVRALAMFLLGRQVRNVR